MAKKNATVTPKINEKSTGEKFVDRYANVTDKP